MQLGGGMKLSLYEEICQLPLESSDDLCVDEDELNLQQEFELQTGDVLYLPRGKVYQNTAGLFRDVLLTLMIVNLCVD